jgi:hypothetical protein
VKVLVAGVFDLIASFLKLLADLSRENPDGSDKRNRDQADNENVLNHRLTFFHLLHDLFSFLNVRLHGYSEPTKRSVLTTEDFVALMR